MNKNHPLSSSLEIDEICIYLEQDRHGGSKILLFDAATHSAILSHWLVCVYLAFITSGLCLITHASQDMYPTFLKNQLHLSDAFPTVILTIAYSCAFVGDVMVGYYSTFFSRRLTMIVVLIIGAALIPTYILPTKSAVIIRRTLEQLCVEGAIAILPIYLLELAPLELRSSVIGTVYEIGNLVAASSPTMIATLAQCFPLSTSQDWSDKNDFDYGKAMGIVLSVVYAFLIPLILLGPEKRNIDELHAMTNNHKEKNRDIDHEPPEALEKLHLIPKSDFESN